jgi:hypothetical protein
MKKLFAIALTLPLFMSPPLTANDSSAALGLGGLTLTQNDAISMDSEDLFISKEQITVKYRFTNTSDKGVETLVSFPLPAVPNEIDEYLGDRGYPDWQEDLQFKTMVDGKPAELSYQETVSIIGDKAVKDIRPRLKQLGWRVDAWNDYGFHEKLTALSASEKAALVKEGLLRKDPDYDHWRPNWQVQAHVTRKQLFPAGKTITVEHSYKPIAGGSVGGMMLKRYRTERNSGFAEYAKAYCIDQPFLAGFDKKIAAQVKREKAKGEDGMGDVYSELWLSYVLKSGANWKGPIKDFRLVIDKGKANDLVSFCMNGVKKISDTQFEVRKTNFEPMQDLEILIVQLYDPATN